MSNLIKDMIRDLTPPIIWRNLSKIKQQYEQQKTDYIEWEYLPEGWEREQKDAKIKGWNVESVLEAYKTNWPGFVENLETGLPFGFSPEANGENRTNLMFHNIIMTYGYALSIASRNKSKISILDWGGGIGHYYLISQKLVPGLMIDYHCKDVPILANYGQSLFPNAHFYSDESCLNRQYDFVVASSSLQYVKDWQNTLQGLAKATEGYLFITRLPIVHKTASYVMVQRPYQYNYDTELLVWCLNKEEFVEYTKTLGLKLEKQFISQTSSFVYNAPEQPEYWGCLLTF